MTQSKEGQTLEFQLNILAVKMKIKFPCQMALENNKQLVTQQVPPSDNSKFTFNQPFSLRGPQNDTYELLAHLYTDKGTRYTSGIIKLLGPQLLRSQGQRLVIPLTKCLDPDAFCQLKVQQVTNIPKNSLSHHNNSKTYLSPDRSEQKQPKTLNTEKYLIGETKSEVYTPMSPNLRVFTEVREREAAKTQIFKTFTKSPPSKFSAAKYLTANYQGQSKLNKNMSQFPLEEVLSQRQSLAESEVLRESYLRLKEKHRKQAELAKEEAHKRMLLEANQNNYKLQIVKLKLKCQTLDKDIADKNQKMRSISSQLTQLQRKDSDSNYLREQCKALQTKVHLLEDTIHSLTAENESLKILINEKNKLKDQTMAGLKDQLEFARAKIEEQKHDLELLTKTKDAIILAKNNDLKMRTQTISKQKQIIKDLQDQAEEKLFQFENSLTNERQTFQLKIDELKATRALIDKQKIELETKNESLLLELDKQKSNIVALEYNNKLQANENNSLGKEVNQLTAMKEKHNELLRQNKFLEEQFAEVRRNLELALQNKDTNINEIINKYEQNKNRHDQNKAETDEKVKNLLLKIQQLELTVANGKAAVEKGSRLNQNIIRETVAVKKVNATLRQELKLAQNRIITLEGDHSSSHSKYQRQTASFKFLLQKYKEQKAAMEKQIEQLKEKVEQLEEIKNEADRKEAGWKLKERHFEQKIEKDTVRWKQTIHRYETTAKQLQATVAEQGSTIDALKGQARDLRKKINDNDLAQIRVKERQQRYRKSIKFSQEKVSSLEQQLKAKADEILLSSEKHKQLTFSLQQRELEIATLKQEVVLAQNRTQKANQLATLLKKDLSKANQLISQLHHAITAKDQSQDSLRTQLKNSRQEVVKEKIKLNKMQTEFDKFKDSIHDIIRIQFVRILNTPRNTHTAPEKLRQSQMSNGRSQHSSKSRVKRSLDAGQLASTLAQKLHQTKNNLWKMVQLNKVLRADNERARQEFQSASNQHQFAKLEYHRDIQDLEEEMNVIIDDKEVQVQSYDHLVIELNAQLREKDLVVAECRGEIDQYNAIITGLRIDFDTNNELNDKKVHTLKTNIHELNQRIDFLNLNVACLQDKNHQLEDKTVELQNQLILTKELLIKNQKNAIDNKENEALLTKDLTLLKKQLKAVQEAREELDIQLNTQKEIKQKYMAMLAQEERKCQKLNEFVSSLILQKESAIKQELQKTEEVNTLQNALFESTHANELLKEDNLSLRQKYDQLREEQKVLTKNAKQFEKQLAEEKSKHSRNIQKLKERETDIQIKREYIKDLESKYRELRDSYYRQVKELSNQLQDKNVSSLGLNKELNNKIIKLQAQNKQAWEESIAIKNQLEHLHHQLLSKGDQVEDLRNSLKKLQQQNVALQEDLASKEFILHERVTQLERLEKIIEEQNANIDHMNNEFQNYQRQYDLNISQTTNEFKSKIDNLTRQYQQKVELAEQEIQFLRQKIDPFEQELNKLQLEKKSQQIENDQTKKMFEEKLKKLQNQRLTNLSSKNNQIKKLAEENKTNLAKIQEKQAEIRRLSQEVEQIKLSAQRAQQMSSYSLEQSKNKEKLLEKQLQNWKNKDTHGLNFKENLLNSLYQNQVEVRKILAQTTKKVTEACSKADVEKLRHILKSMQSNVATAMMAHIEG